MAELHYEHDNAEDWLAFKTTGSREARERLIVAYTPLVRFVASRVGSGLPQSVEQADLVSYGTFGLIDAIEKFDLERGFKFETYAIARIKGAILDELRSYDWVPRSVRGKQRSVETAYRKLEAKLHRAPTEEELAEELDVSLKQLRDIRTQIGNAHISTFDEAPPGSEEGLSVAEVVADPAANVEDDLSSASDVAEMRKLLAGAAAEMDEREQMILVLYYHEGLTLAEIGHVLGVTESRICQIHTKAVLHLRARLIPSELEPA